MKRLFFATILYLSLFAGAAHHAVHAQSPTPSAPVASEQKHLDDDEDKDEDIKSAIGDRIRGRGSDDMIPIATFVFVLVLVLGSRFMKERTHRQRLEVLKTMIDKGQTVPEPVVKEILGGGHRSERMRSPEGRLARGTSMTVVGVGLLGYSYLTQGHHHSSLIVGIVLLGLGIGNLFAYSRSSAVK